MFINDNELLKNNDLFINIECMKKGDFSKLNKEEKYSALVILMKYLMPLIYKMESNLDFSYLRNIKFHFLNNCKKELKYRSNDSSKKKYKGKNKKNILLKPITTKRSFNHTNSNSNLLTPINSNFNSIENISDNAYKLIPLSPRITTIKCFESKYY